MMGAADIELRLLSQPRYLCVARAAIGTAIAKIGFQEEEVGQVTVALDEALANVMRHGYAGREDGLIWIRFTPRCSVDQVGFEIEIDDETPPADPAMFVGRELDEVRPGGLGMNIIKQVMDEVVYSQRPEGGMRLTLTKCVSKINQGETSHE